MSDSRPTLLVLDDEPSIGEIVVELAAMNEFSATAIARPSEFIENCRGICPDVIVLDLQMPDMDGIEVLRTLADAQARSSIILMTGMDNRTVAAAETFGTSLGLRIVGAVRKPFSAEELSTLMLRARALQRPVTAQDLEDGIQRDELTVFYQPIAERFPDGSWDITSVEALLRWHHPQRGILSPNAFVEMGEVHGLGRRMTDLVLQRAVEQLKGWHARRLDLGLRVNVAAHLINDVRFPDRLAALLLEQGLDPSLMTIEITETAMLGRDSDILDILDILTRLRVKGLNLAIDDFGIGYSSLTQLFQMPFNEMKIDKSLVIDTPRSREATIMVSALVDLGHKLDLKVCAEGIESRETLDFLGSIGVDYVQGFHISRPLPAKEIPDVLQRWQSQPRIEAARLLG